MTDIDAQRGLAARVAARSQLRDVRLSSAACEITAVPSQGRQLSFDLNIGVESELDQSGAALIVKCRYRLVLQESEAAPTETPAVNEADITDDFEDDDSTLASLDFTYQALFELTIRDTDEAPSIDEVNAFAATTGSFALYPFAREYVRDATSRMGLPPLTLGVMLQPITRE